MARGKYRRKRERKMQQSITVHMLGLSVRVANLLEKNEIMTLADLNRYSETDLLALPGLGSSAVEEIRSELQKRNIEQYHKKGE